MAPIDKALFRGTENISAEDLQRIEIGNRTEDVTSVLKDYKWGGNSVVGFVVIELSDDNSRITGGGFQTKGAFPQRKAKIKASSLWASADSAVTLNI